MDNHVNSEEENITEVGSCAVHNFESRKTLKTTSTIESLPGDVLFDILARVPAQDIHSAARLVCHKWYRTTRTHDFVRAHLQQSTCGLFIHRPGSHQRNETVMFATPKGVEISNYKFTGEAFSSCNGLVLEHQKNKKHESVFRITNPATNQHMDLPSFGGKAIYNSAIVYAVASKEYKAVCSFYSNSGKQECAILTAGVDEDWKRRVDIQHLSLSVRDTLFTQTPLYTDGFVHWAPQYGRGRDSECVVTLNVETEIITQFQALPRNLCAGYGGETKLLYLYLPMGSCLSLLIARENNETFPIWDQVWVMKSETGEWSKVMSIDSGSLKRALHGVSASFYPFYPVGWLKCREVFVLASPSSSSCIVYNVRTHEIESSFELGFNPLDFVAHQNTLVWLDGC